MLFFILLALSMRFFFFDFILFKNVRNYLRTKGYLFNKLLHCPFCQGFWCGLGVFLATQQLTCTLHFFVSLFSFGFVTAYLAMMTTAIFYPLVERYEEINPLPSKQD